jgi:CubicO group peptidase (beta-lactamase class C family)
MSGVRVDESMIHGEVAPGFEDVRKEFERNFTKRGELGAACCVYHEGEKVVDLWGGYRDEKKRLPWEEDTLVLVFSTTKGMAAMTIAVAHSRGWLDFDERVAAYWPEFAQAGKEKITVRQLLSHQAGLSAIDEPLTPEVLADLDGVAQAIARQAPSCEPGTKQGYHGISLGFYEGELIRRVDPQGRSLGRFFAEEIAEPLGIEFYIGLPEEVPEERIAVIKDLVIAMMIFHLGDMPGRFSLAMLNPRSLSSRSFLNPRLKNPSDLGVPPLCHVEIPAANGIGQVRGVARAYSAFAMGGGELGIGEETMKALTQPAVRPSGGCFDQVLKLDTNFSLGYMKPFPDFDFGSSVRSFGTVGAGGSFGYADPDARIGYAYAMSRMGYHIFDDPRDKAIRDALYKCL